MDQNWAISFVRTVVASFVVGVLGQLLLFAWSDDVGAGARSVVAALIACAYYIVARLLQIQNPKLGFLLIIAAQPHYTEEGSEANQNELLTSVVRTVVPITVGWLLSWLIFLAFDIDEPAWTLLASGLVIGAYYAGLRWVEVKSAPLSTARNVTGVMLGAKAVPHY